MLSSPRSKVPIVLSFVFYRSGVLNVLFRVLRACVSSHSGNPVIMLSSKASPSNVLSTYIPPGTAEHMFNVTAVVLVSDNLGSTAVTSLGEDGIPVTIVSTSPGEVILTL